MRNSPIGIKRLLLFLIIPVLGISVLSSLFSSPSVGAASTISLTTEQQSASVTYYNVLRVCVYNYMYGDINTVGINNSSNADPSKVSWFNVSSGVTNFVVYNKPSGQSCEQIAALALKLWGFKADGSDFLTKMGYTLQQTGAQASAPRYHGSPDSTTRLAKFESLVQSISGAFPIASNFVGDASLDGATKYYAYKSVLGTCGVKSLGLVSSLNASQTDLVTNNKAVGNTSYTIVALANGDGTTSNYGYTYANNAGTLYIYGHASESVSKSAGGGGYLSTSCKDALSTLTSTSQAASTDGAASQCAKTYTDINQIKSCAAGASNVSNIGYCAKTFPDRAASSLGPAVNNVTVRDACYAGQGFNGGDACYDDGGYTTDLLFAACVAGRANSTDVAYCTTTYPGQYSAGKFTAQTAQVKACQYGQKLGPAAGIQQSKPLCELNPNAEGCTDKTATTSCGIGGIGWIVCPALGFVASVTDTAFSFLATTFLETPASLVASGTNNPTYNAWSIMRNFANVAFVIAFLVIIFSQISNVGVTNYGVKKLLPRLVIAAILVNISYFVCQIAVDLSNILGYGVKAMFDAIGGLTQTPSSDFTTEGATGNGFGIAAVTTTVLAGGIGLAFAISVPVLLAAVIALLFILLILFGRTALIILLVVISPLAFVAYLLPNTEDLFKKWRKLFMTLLVLFPIIAVVFGASNLAAGIIAGSASYAGNTDDNSVLQMVAIGVAIVPLFAVPVLLRGALNGAGAIGQKLSGLSSKASGGIGGKISSTSRAGQYAKYYKGEVEKNRALAQSGSYTGKNPFHKLTSAVNGRINERTGKFGSRASAQGDALADADDAELLKNATSKISSMTGADGKTPLSTAQLIQMASGQDITHDGTAKGTVIHPAKTFDQHARRAATQKAAAVANVAEAHQLLNASKGMETALERKTLAAALRTSSVSGKAPWLTGKTLGAIEQGGITADEAAIMAINDGKVTAEALASGDVTAVKHLVDTVTNMPAGPDRVKAIAALQAAEKGYQANPLLHDKVVKGQGHDTAISSITGIV